MRLCKKVVDYLQVISPDGDVSVCPWIKNAGGVIGNLKENSFYEIWHGEKVQGIRERLANDDYSECNIDACPYLARNELEDCKVTVDCVPEYPQMLSLSYEMDCNYNCICCALHQRREKNSGRYSSADYDVTEKELEKILPHVRHISANGRAELFCSQRTLKILANWKPLAPKEDISVTLETNGSLFDEMHWKQIENLGAYNLKVAITVMSFDEHVYQILSGCRYPISKIEDNLRFVKQLREQGIINYLELATVVQERNFRTLPEFTRRCIEEFGADCVRLRPYEPYYCQPPEVEWFANVRNVHHPYHAEYLEVMKHPILKHPKVWEWSGGLASHYTGEHPFKREAERNGIVSALLSKFILSKADVVQWVRKRMKESDSEGLAVYGCGVVGKAFIETIKDDISITGVYDSDNHAMDNVVLPDKEKLNEESLIMITPVKQFDEIAKYLVEQLGIHSDRLVSIESVLKS